jgi:peroxiredoxin
MRLLKRTLPILLVLLASSLACSLFSAGGQLKIGQPAPDFQLTSSQGNDYTLADYQGHPVLLNFWATWCGPCVEEMPQIQRVFEANRTNGLVVFAVSSEAMDQVAEFGADHDLSFPLLIDEKGRVSSQYRVSAYPTSYFVDAQGVIQDIVIGSMDRRGFETHLRPLFDPPLPTATTSAIPHQGSLSIDQLTP